MSRKSPSPTEIEWRVLDGLQALTGKCWKEARGEYNDAYNDMAVWILLMRAEDIDAAHRKFCDVILAYSDMIRFTVSYIVRVPEGEMLLEVLSGNEIDLIGVERKLGSNPTLDRSGSSVFRR